jgi:hypothetical protein
VYDEGRFFTVTGDVLKGYEAIINEMQSTLDVWYAEVMSEPVGGVQPARLPDQQRSADGIGIGGRPQSWQEIAVEVSASAQPPMGKMLALMDRNSQFKKAFRHELTTLKDDSDSGYDMALARHARNDGWSLQEICNLLIYHRVERGAGKVERVDYYQRTLFRLLDDEKRTAALDTVDKIQGMHTGALSAGDKDEAREAIYTLTGLWIERYVQYGSSPASYGVYLPDGDYVCITRASEVRNQSTWQDIAQEKTERRVPFAKLKNAQWHALLRCLGAICEYEETSESNAVNELIEQLKRYQASAYSGRTADVIDERKPFLEDGALYFSRSSLVDWLTTHKVGSIPLSGLTSLLKGAGARDKVRVTAKRVSGEYAQRDYWRIFLSEEE